MALNGAVFYTDVSQAQQFEFFPNAGIQAVSSIDKVRIWGLEADANIEVLDSLDFFFGGGYIDSEIRRLRAAPQFEGNRAPYTANYNLFAGLQLVQPIANGLTLLGRVQYTRTGSIWFDSSNLPGSKRDPVDLVDLRLGVGSDRWEITFWAKNLFNEKYNNEAIPLLAVLQATYKAPTRSYGVEAKVRF